MKKIVSISRIVSALDRYRAQGEKIVLAGGCFDILHIGHISFLEKAKSAGGILVLLLESDQAIKLLKGKERPVNSLRDRAKVLSAIEFVDFVVPLPGPFKSEDYNDIVRKISPDIIAVTAGDPNVSAKKIQARKAGGVVKVVLKKIPEHSTTKLLGYF